MPVQRTQLGQHLDPLSVVERRPSLATCTCHWHDSSAVGTYDTEDEVEKLFFFTLTPRMAKQSVRNGTVVILRKSYKIVAVIAKQQ